MKKTSDGIKARLSQDIGILGFLICVAAVIITSYSSGETEKTECLVMFLITCVPILFCVYKMTVLSYSLTGIEVLSYAVYKIYMWTVWNRPFSAVSFAWLIIPVLMIIFLSVFIGGSSRLEAENDILREQVEELVLVDHVTGLYNMRGLHNDLTRQISYCRRNNTKICLMEIRLKYGQELKKFLTPGQFIKLRKMMADTVENAVRIEDRVYAIDEDGTLAIMLTCDKQGAEIVCKRLKDILEDRGSFKGVIEISIKLEVKIGYVEYDSEKISTAVDFIAKTENETQYDV